MAKKGVNHISEAGEAAVEKVAQVEEIKATANEEMVDSLKKSEESKEKKIENPYPDHKGYTEVWKTLSPEQQKEMKENIRITEDGKVEVIKMKKSFSLLNVKPNGRDFIDGSHVDKNGNVWVKWLTYLTSDSAQIESLKQWKYLLQNETAVDQFLSCFPWNNENEKTINIVNLFELKISGIWDVDGFRDQDSFEIWTIGLSKPCKQKNPDYGNIFYRLIYDKNWGGIESECHSCFSPFLAFENAK